MSPSWEPKEGTKQTKNGHGKNTKHPATDILTLTYPSSMAPRKPTHANMEQKDNTPNTHNLRLSGLVKPVKRAYSWAPPKPNSTGRRAGETRCNKQCRRHACSCTLYMPSRSLMNTVRVSGAQAQDWNIRERYGLERSGLHQGEEAMAARTKGEENKNKSKVRRREDTKNQGREEGGGGEDRVQRQPARYEGAKRKAWCLVLGQPGPRGGHTGLEHLGGGKQTGARSRTAASGEERARNRATRIRTSEGQKPGTGASRKKKRGKDRGRGVQG